MDFQSQFLDFAQKKGGAWEVENVLFLGALRTSRMVLLLQRGHYFQKDDGFDVAKLLGVFSVENCFGSILSRFIARACFSSRDLILKKKIKWTLRPLSKYIGSTSQKRRPKTKQKSLKPKLKLFSKKIKTVHFCLDTQYL